MTQGAVMAVGLVKLGELSVAPGGQWSSWESALGGEAWEGCGIDGPQGEGPSTYSLPHFLFRLGQWQSITFTVIICQNDLVSSPHVRRSNEAE